MVPVSFVKRLCQPANDAVDELLALAASSRSTGERASNDKQTDCASEERSEEEREWSLAVFSGRSLHMSKIKSPATPT
eukprot:4890621-Pyramimonas_sp.AAC.1